MGRASQSRGPASSQPAFGVFLVRRAQSQPAPSPICPFPFSFLCTFLIKAGQQHTVTHISCKHLPALPKSQEERFGKHQPLLCDIPDCSAKANKARQQAQVCVFSFNRTSLSVLE